MKMLCGYCSWSNYIGETNYDSVVFDCDVAVSKKAHGKSYMAYICPNCGGSHDKNYFDLFYTVQTIESHQALIDYGRGLADIVASAC